MRRAFSGLESLAVSGLVAVGLAGALTPSGCNNSNRGMSFDMRLSNPNNYPVGRLHVYFATSMTKTEITECREAVRDHWNYFSANYGVNQNSPMRNLFVYDVPMINSPWQLGVQGWADVDHPNIHVVKGGANETPDLLRQLVFSYLYPYSIHEPNAPPNPLYWFVVHADLDAVNSAIRARRPQYP